MTETASVSSATPDGKKRTGAQLVVHALEQLPVTYTFGIPGVQNTEIYDALNSSEKIRPVLVTHEGGAAFMADAVSRTSPNIGTLVIVPAAGITHAMSGIGEAFLDGIPMLVLCGGIRRDTGRAYQLHDLDHHRLLSAVTKKTFLIREHREIVPTLFEAYRIATSGEPGPVFVEIPADLQLFKGEAGDLPAFAPVSEPDPVDGKKINEALDLLETARFPGLFLGWGCRDRADLCVRLAEALEAPVSTTLQGLSVFPATHPLHVGMGFGPSAVPAAENAFKECDCLVAVGVRFAEIPTGSYGAPVPENLIHVDINPEVFHRNYPARVAIQGDAGAVLAALVAGLGDRRIGPLRKVGPLRDRIARDKALYRREWRAAVNDRVNPAHFFDLLRKHLSEDAITVVDDGNHTYLAAELFPVLRSRHFICPTDFNCMGYCVPAAIGAKMANPDKQVVGIVGDGAFLMTCMEILTATTNRLGIAYFVFHDGELSQISQAQEIPFNRKTCTILGDIRLEGVAKATGATYLEIRTNDEARLILPTALELAGGGRAVIVDTRIDYSRRTRFTKGTVKTVLKRFPLGDKFRFIGRAMARKITG